jgi:hypothetical protein
MPGNKMQAVVENQHPKTVRSYFRIDENNSTGLSGEDLLDLAASGKLTLSFALPGRTIHSGYYVGGAGCDECIEAEGTSTDLGLTPLLKEYVWHIIAEGQATIEYTYKSDEEFSKIEYSDSNPLPVVHREQVLITKRDLDLYKNGEPADPEPPSSMQGHAIAKAFACLYAVEVGHVDKEGHVNLPALLTDMQTRIQDEKGGLPLGLKKQSFYGTMKGIDKIAKCVDDLKQYY